MKLFLIRHGKSDKSMQDTMSHNQFEFLRPLVEGEVEKAREIGRLIKNKIANLNGFDFVWSGKMRSMQTVVAVAEGLGIPSSVIQTNLREDFGLTYLAEKKYWEAAEHALKSGVYTSHADFFLNNKPTGHTFSAEYIRANMRSVIRRAIERNAFLGNQAVIMVSHEPVLSLCMSDLTEKSVNELGGSFNELEYAVLTVSDDSQAQHIELEFRDTTYEVGSKLF